MLHAIIPVKSLDRAKMRLAPVLAPDERRGLVLAMLADVLHTLRATPQVQRISVISRDDTVLHAATRGGAMPITEYASDLNGALTQAATHAVAQGATALLVLPADLPLVAPRDIDTLTAALGAGAGVALAPSRDGGTNALLARPPLALPFLFGVGSLARHAEAAAARGLAVQLVRSPGMLLDVDQPDDLALLADADGVTAAQQFARALYTSHQANYALCECAM